MWQDIPTGIKIFVVVTLTIFGIGHYRGYLWFTHTSCFCKLKFNFLVNFNFFLLNLTLVGVCKFYTILLVSYESVFKLALAGFKSCCCCSLIYKIFTKTKKLKTKKIIVFPLDETSILPRKGTHAFGVERERERERERESAWANFMYGDEGKIHPVTNRIYWYSVKYIFKIFLVYLLSVTMKTEWNIYSNQSHCSFESFSPLVLAWKRHAFSKFYCENFFYNFLVRLNI